MRGESLSDVRALSHSTTAYYEIYKVYQSTMRAPTNQRMSIEDMREAARMSSRGHSNQNIARKYAVSIDYIRKVIKNVKETETYPI